MELINKLGKKLAKDFENKFQGFSEEQMNVLKKTKMYLLFSNDKTKWGNKPRLNRSEVESLGEDYNERYNKQLNIISRIYSQQNLVDVDDSIKISKELLESNDSGNTIIAANILNGLKIK